MHKEMTAADVLKPSGSLALNIYRKGRLIDSMKEENLIVLSGKSWLAKLLTGESIEKISHIGVGTNGAEPVLTDTDLTNKEMIPVTKLSVSGQTLSIFFEINEETANGMDIFEFGIFGEEETLFARKVRGRSIPKDEELKIEGTWTIRF